MVYEVNGNGCPYLHKPEVRQYGGKGGYAPADTRPHSGGKGQSPHTPEKSHYDGLPPGTCWFFLQKDECKKGDTCDHKHTPNNK